MRQFILVIFLARADRLFTASSPQTRAKRRIFHHGHSQSACRSDPVVAAGLLLRRARLSRAILQGHDDLSQSGHSGCAPACAGLPGDFVLSGALSSCCAWWQRDVRA